MKVLVIGGSGHVGSTAVEALSKNHEVISVGSSTSPGVDLTDTASIERLFEEVGEVDAIVSAFGKVPFKPVTELSEADVVAAFEGKVLSQFNLVRIGSAHVRDGGSITLITGVTARNPVRTASAAGLANGALESFVIGAAGEMPRGIRLNAVSPTVLDNSPAYFDAFHGFPPVAAELVGQAFVRSVEGLDNGKVFILD